MQRFLGPAGPVRRAARRCRHPVALVAACFAVAAGHAASAAAQASIHTEIDTTLVTVGDRIVLTVSVDHPPDASVMWPDSLDLSPFEVLSARALPPRTGEAETRSIARFELAAFELGELEIPSFEVGVVGADGSRTDLETDRFGVEVVSVGADEGSDIRDIRGPLAIPLSALRIAAWVLLLALMTGAAFFGYRRWRARRGGAEVAPRPAPTRLAHEVALEALDRLESAGLLERDEIKEYHIEVSEILRRYVEGRFRVPALEMTTWEVVDGLERVGVGLEFREGLRRFLDHCDLVKFAKVRPGDDASREALRLGRQLVEESIPRVAAEV